MSRAHIPAALRERVRRRAQGLCEYCLVSESDATHAFHVDHVISGKHGGPTEEHNLAFCCPFCNHAKGTDIAGRVADKLVRLFNPRIDQWPEHFFLQAASINARSSIGAVTVQLLGLNDPSRLAFRRALVAEGLYPSATARRLIA